MDGKEPHRCESRAGSEIWLPKRRIRLAPDFERNELEASYGLNGRLFALNEKALALVSKDYSAFAYNYGSGGVICPVPTDSHRVRVK